MTDFNRRALNKLAQEFSQRDAESAMTAALAGSTADLSRQPELSFESFRVDSMQLAVSPDCSYRLLAAAINMATTELLVYLYNISASHLLELLAQAKNRGIRVKVMIDANDPHDTSGEEWNALKALGVTLRLAPSKAPRRVFTVCHQKFVVIDRRSMVLGSANWASTAIPLINTPGQFRKGNREWLARIDHPGLAHWFAQLFEADWDIPESHALALESSRTITTISMNMSAALAGVPPKVFDIQPIHQNAVVLPLVSPVNYLPEVLQLIQGAKRSIDIQQQYIQAGNGVNELLKAVHERRKNNVRVRIVSSALFDSWKKTQLTLEAAGLVDQLRSIDLRTFAHCHNKGILVDGRFSVVSSTNWSENSITRAREAGLLIDSVPVARYFSQIFRQDWSTGLTPGQIQASTINLSSAELI